MWTEKAEKLRDSYVQDPAQVHVRETTASGLDHTASRGSIATSVELKSATPVLLNGEKGQERSKWDSASSQEEKADVESDREPQQEPPMTFKRFMVFVAMGFLWTGSQIPLYLFGGIIALIMGDIGGADRYVWIALGNLIPLAVVSPFVGVMSDLLGRKNLAIFASTLLITGNAVCATANIMNVFIAGQTLIGVGAAIAELTALAVAGEIAPTKKRGLYIGGMIMTILPFCPSVLYAAAITADSTWRYIGLFCGLWSFTGLVLTVSFYWPPPRDLSGRTKWEIIKTIDWEGALFLTAGLTLFLAGLTWAGNQYAWGSTHVAMCLGIGGGFLVAFVVWEFWFAPYPMFPHRLRQDNPRVLAVILITTFASGANFFAVLVFWPSQYYFMYAGNDVVSIGVGSLPVGFGIIGGSIIVSTLITIFKGRIRLLMICACIVMTAGNGAMACADLNNLNVLYLPVTLACLGVGAVIVPNQIICSIICPADLIGTITAITISVRVIGGAIAYSIYYNLLRNKFTKEAYKYIVPAALKAGVHDPEEIYHIAILIGANLKDEIAKQPYINSTAEVQSLLYAGRVAFSHSFPQVYYVSIAFGAISIISCFFLRDIGKFMTGDVAVALM